MVSRFGNAYEKSDNWIAARARLPHAFSVDIENLARDVRRGRVGLKAGRDMPRDSSQLLGLLQQQMQGDSL